MVMLACYVFITSVYEVKIKIDLTSTDLRRAMIPTGQKQQMIENSESIR